MRLTLATASAEETEAVAARLAERLRPGDVVTISGELGSGKTTFVRGACRSLGVGVPVTSPTFTIGHRYRGRIDVSHLDLFRFSGLSPAEWGDLEPYFDDAVVFVEWPEAGLAALPAASVAVRIEHAGGDRRTIEPPRGRGRAARRNRVMLLLAFDTATDVATSALVDDGRVLGERTSVPRTLLEDVDELLRNAGASPADLDALVVGTGPGSFTSTRIGLAVAQGLGLALELPVAGISTLEALARAREGVYPVVDARRREVFVLGPRVLAPTDLEVGAGDDGRRERGGPVSGDAGRQGGPRPRRRRRDPSPACPLARGSRERVPAGRGGRAPVRPLPRREGPEPRMNLELRRLEQRDLDTVEVIEQASYPTPWSRSMFAAELRKPSALALGAYLDTGELVGYAFVSRYVDAWHVMNVAVAPEFRRRGIATALLARLFDITADDRRRGYTLEVRVSNADAIQLYEQLGFEARGIRRGYYTDNREDALIMWRESAPSEKAS